jgi:SH3-like domain-containing protein
MSGWRVAVLLCLVATGCATTPPPPPPPEPPPAPREEPPPPPPPVAAPCLCDEQNREIAKLRHELTTKETELRELRAQHRDQLKALQESSRKAARAMVKAHRTATQAEAAAYIAEVEVALETTRASPDATLQASLIAVAEGMLQSAQQSFKARDYAAAMDRAAQAQQLLGVLDDRRPASAGNASNAAEIPFPVPIPLRLKSDAHVRRAPQAKARVIATVKATDTVTVIAYKGGWLRVELHDGRGGWLNEGMFALK